MSEQKKTPETTIATLDLGATCLLTLTNKHLRGQVTKLVEVGRDKQGNPIKKLQKDSLDVLLSGIAGYSLDHIDNAGARKASRIMGCLIAIGGLLAGIFGLANDIEILGWGFVGIPVGVIMYLIGRKYPLDIWAFAINVMGGKNEIPVAAGQTEAVRDFITKLQNAKIAYDEANG